MNVSSGAATSARLGAAGYCGSKAAIDMLTQALAIELGPYAIRVNAVSPGLVTDAPLRTGDPGITPYMQMMLEMTPLRRTGEPADIAEVVAFVASDRAAWMTGTIVQVSGGSTRVARTSPCRAWAKRACADRGRRAGRRPGD